jgi:hypothetical protein
MITMREQLKLLSNIKHLFDNQVTEEEFDDFIEVVRGNLDFIEV